MSELKFFLATLNIHKDYVDLRSNRNDFEIIKKYFNKSKEYEVKGLNAVIAKHHGINPNLLAFNDYTKGIHDLNSFLYNGTNVKKKSKSNDIPIQELENHYFFNSRICNSMSSRTTGLFIPLAIYCYRLKEKSGILDLNDNSENLPIELYEFPTFKAISAGYCGNHRVLGVAIAYELLKKCILRAEYININKIENNNDKATRKIILLIKELELNKGLELDIKNNVYELCKNDKIIKLTLNEHIINIDAIFFIIKNQKLWFSFMKKYNINYIGINQENKNLFSININNNKTIHNLSIESINKFSRLPYFISKMDKYYKRKTTIELLKIMLKDRKIIYNNFENKRYILHYLDSKFFRNYNIMFWNNLLSKINLKLNLE